MIDIQNHIIYEDNHLFCVNKPSGVLSQKDNTGDASILEYGKAYIKKKYHKPGNVFLGLPHRLDRPASGILILARTSKALVRLNRMFSDRLVKKQYLVLVEKNEIPLHGTIRGFIKKNEKNNKVRYRSKNFEGAKNAILHYSLIGIFDNAQLIEVDLITGRKHQIRVQLASMGSPVIGDLKYGHQKKWNGKKICLHCHRVELVHPVTQKELTLTAPVPHSQMWKEAKELGY